MRYSLWKGTMAHNRTILKRWWRDGHTSEGELSASTENLTYFSHFLILLSLGIPYQRGW